MGIRKFGSGGGNCSASSENRIALGSSLEATKYTRRRRWGRPVSPDRSKLMSKIRGQNTGCEIIVQDVVRGLRFRFLKHLRDLPGSPDLVFPRRKKTIFVHGCFWHRHAGCRRCTTPKTRAHFWSEKFKRNVERDARTMRTLRGLGWEILVIWECQTFNQRQLTARLKRFLTNSQSRSGANTECDQTNIRSLQ